MFKTILFLSNFVRLSAFLLDSKTTNTSGRQTTNENRYLTFDDKAQLIHDILKVHQEQKDLLDLLTSQVQQRFIEMEKNFQKQGNTNETCVSLQKQFMEVLHNNSDLRMSLERAERSQNESSAEITQMKTKINELEQELGQFRQLKAINQLQFFEKLKESLHTVDASVNLLMSHEQSRNQDFLALYNITTKTQSELEHFKRQTVSDVNAQNHSITSLTYQTKNGLDNLNTTLRTLNTTLTSQMESGLDSLNSTITSQMEIELDTLNTSLTASLNSTSDALQRQINENREKVALTGCLSSGQKISGGSVITFSDIKSSYGVDSLSSFKSSGKFTCMSAGLYYVSVSILSNTKDEYFEIHRNTDVVIYGYVSNNPRSEFYSGTVVTTTDLQVGDIIYVTAGRDIFVNSQYSCITIIKLKHDE